MWRPESRCKQSSESWAARETGITHQWNRAVVAHFHQMHASRHTPVYEPVRVCVRVCGRDYFCPLLLAHSCHVCVTALCHQIGLAGVLPRSVNAALQLLLLIHKSVKSASTGSTWCGMFTSYLILDRRLLLRAAHLISYLSRGCTTQSDSRRQRMSEIGQKPLQTRQLSIHVCICWGTEIEPLWRKTSNPEMFIYLNRGAHELWMCQR